MKPEIIEESDHYKIILPKEIVSKKNVEIFLSNILRSQSGSDDNDPVKNAKETLIKRWPNEEKFSPKPYSELSVLAADDQSSVRKLLKGALKEIGFGPSNIEEAADGSEAIKLLIGKKYDIIFSDWNMPGLNGLDLLKIVKSVPGLKNSFFIMVTTLGDQKCVMDAIESGIDGYIIKPFTTAQIEKVLKKTIP